MALTSSFAARQIDRLLRNLTAQMKRTLRSVNADAVHDLRVSIRRFDQALLLFGLSLNKKEAGKTRRRLKKIMGLAGEVRNCDIAEELLSRSFPDVRQRVEAQREKAQGCLAAGLVRRRAQGWPENAAAGLELVSGRRLPDPFRTARDMTANFLHLGAEAAHQGSPEALHRFRIAAKHYRYTLELLAPILGARRVAAHLSTTKSVQTRLGNVNDCETVRVMAASWKAGRKVDAFLKERERAQMKKFREEWKQRFGDPEQCRRWSASLDKARAARSTRRHSSE